MQSCAALAGADPGEVKWVYSPPPLFLSPLLLFFFSYPSNIDLKHLNQALVLLHYYKNSPPSQSPGSAPD